MKHVVIFRKTYRLALGVLLVFVLSLLATSLIRRHVLAADRSVMSLYLDRLLPTRDLACVQERLYQNELLFQEHLHAPSPETRRRLEAQMQDHLREMDLYMTQFAHTYLIDQEVQSLAQYLRDLHQYQQQQQHLLALSNAGHTQEAALLYASESQPLFQQLTRTLQTLTSLQTSEGLTLYEGSHHKLLEANLLTYLLIGVTLLLGVAAQVLLLESRVFLRTPPKPTLN
ncbi:Four helix bundle sensory module for signal transduction [Catalinimonas alkaloidigena]|uniref:Four helix bundle sensory module for signal transduction n=1 Tax=Catalinimonas alkaloidigena TaxID=1075417 RepID=A0A1G9TJN5_9BACT|nr:MCP four helix bundle domain-containing protein [Catalinimonas alkaloidigena]SDM47870.1 Four helix bundle sensory module for signal transduction [Catalinimonas alkaloidigena]